MKIAQIIHASFLGVDLDFFNRETAAVAVEQTRELTAHDKAPHANRGTPPRPRYPRKPKLRLFKDHRP